MKTLMDLPSDLIEKLEINELLFINGGLLDVDSEAKNNGDEQCSGKNNGGEVCGGNSLWNISAL